MQTRSLVWQLTAVWLAALAPAFATNLVTGNGFGFAVVSPDTGAVTKFYAHPYSFAQEDEKSPLSEGVATANFIKALDWGEGTAKFAAEYEEDSHVIHVRGAHGDGFVWMPFGLQRAVVIVDWEPVGLPNSLRVVWSAPVRSRATLRTGNSAIQILRIEGIEEKLMLIPLEGREASLDESGAVLNGAHGWALVTVNPGDEPESVVKDFERWRGALSPRALEQREIADVERWRVKPPAHLAAQQSHLWRQSEVMLRMAQSQEANREGRYGNGLIVASLPDGVWFTPWVRDMAWATVALARMGHRAEARAAVLAYFNARPTGKMRAETVNADYQISVVRYWGNGAEEPFFTEEGSTNIEFDDWGEALWALGQYLRTYDDTALLREATFRGTVYESARDFIVKPLIANLEPYGGGEIVAADTSIWEERQKGKKHFAFSTAMAIVGLKEFASAARKAGDDSGRAEAEKHAALLKTGFDAAFVRNGELHGTLEPGEKNDIDGALLELIHLGVVADPALIANTVKRMDLLKVDSGGWRRVRSNYTDPKIFEYWYERQEFLFVDVKLAEVDRILGRDQEAATIMSRIVTKAAADHDIVPEMYVALPCQLFPGAVGDPTGARPMVGYGAAAYLLDILDQADRSRH